MNKIQCEFKRWEWDFPGGTVDGSPLGGCRGHGFDSWSRRIPHAEEQRGPCAATTEVCVPRSCVPPREKSLQREVCAPRLESSPLFPQLEKAQVQQRRHSTTKKKEKTHKNSKNKRWGWRIELDRGRKSVKRLPEREGTSWYNWWGYWAGGEFPGRGHQWVGGDYRHVCQMPCKVGYFTLLNRGNYAWLKALGNVWRCVYRTCDHKNLNVSKIFRMQIAGWIVLLVVHRERDGGSEPWSW